MVLAGVLSPAVLLGIERANNDLLVFFIISVAILAAQRAYLISVLAILVGFVLKLYPVCSLTLLLRAKKQKFIFYMLVAFVFVAGHILFTFHDILLIDKATPECRIGYGMGVFVRILGDVNVNLGRGGKGLSYLLVILSFIFSFSALSRKDSLPARNYSDLYLGAFRAGASIYIGLFLLARNFPYRLMFLIFVIPQLLVWAKEAGRSISLISKTALTGIYTAMWSLVIARMLSGFPWYAEFSIRAISNWCIFFCFMYLMFWSMPEWVKGLVRRS
jgi:hypothetical protein